MMQRMNEKKLSFILILAYVVLAACLVFLIPDTQREKYLNQTAAGVSGPLSAETEIRQTFYAESEVLGVNTQFATYAMVPQHTYGVDLIDEETDQVLESFTLNGPEIEDNGFVSIVFAKPLAKGKEYSLRYYAKEENPDPVAIWVSGSDTYGEGALYVNGAEQAADAVFSILTKGPDLRPLCYGILLILFVLLLLALPVCKRFARLRILLIYAGIFGMFLLRSGYFLEYSFLGAYDENAHVSYLAYLEKEHKVIPEFEHMYLLVPENYDLENEHTAHSVSTIPQGEEEYRAIFTDTVSYLGHPPLYYWLMTAGYPVHMDGDLVIVNMNRIHLMNLGLMLVTLLLILYIGFTRIKKEPYLHLLYGAAAIGVPMLSVVCLSANNDNLTMLTVAIFFLAGLRYVEGKRGFLTYLLLSVGICATLLTKLTAGLMVCLTAFGFILYSSVKEKSLKGILNLSMLATLPIYLVMGAYFLLMLKNYHSVQPSLAGLVGEEVFKTYPIVYVDPADRVPMSSLGFVYMFARKFIMQWGNGIIDIEGFKWYHPLLWPILALWLVPVGAVLGLWRKGDENRYLGLFSASVLVVALIQLVRAYKDYMFVSGHAGTQSRYYLCAILLFAFALSRWAETKEKAWQKGAVLVFSVWITLASFLALVMTRITYL